MTDVRGRLDELAAASPGMTDPFDSIYKIVYLLTQRAVGATEIANDRKLLDTTLGLFESIEQSAKPYQVMFPWLPSPALINRFYAGTRMYMIFKNLVDTRMKTGRREEDALQYLIDQGDSIEKMIAVRATTTPVRPTRQYIVLTSKTVHCGSTLRRTTQQRHQRCLGPLLPRRKPILARRGPKRNQSCCRQVLSRRRTTNRPPPAITTRSMGARLHPHGLLLKGQYPLAAPRHRFPQEYKRQADLSWRPDGA